MASNPDRTDKPVMTYDAVVAAARDVALGKVPGVELQALSAAGKVLVGCYYEVAGGGGLFRCVIGAWFGSVGLLGEHVESDGGTEQIRDYGGALYEIADAGAALFVVDDDDRGRLAGLQVLHDRVAGLSEPRSALLGALGIDPSQIAA